MSSGTEMIVGALVLLEVLPTPLVWAVVSGIEGWAEVVPAVSAIRHVGGPSPAGVSTRDEIEQPGLPKATHEVTEWVPDSRFVWVLRQPGLVSTAVHAVVPDGDGSRVELSLVWSGMLGGLARRMGEKKGGEMVAAEATALARKAERP